MPDERAVETDDWIRELAAKVHWQQSTHESPVGTIERGLREAIAKAGVGRKDRSPISLAAVTRPGLVSVYRSHVAIAIGVALLATVTLLLIRLPEYGWVAALVSAFGAIASMMASGPKRIGAAILAATLTLVPGIWAVAKERAESQRKLALRSVVVRELAGRTTAFASTLSNAVLAASDGWLPSTDEELFSSRSVSLFCSELDVEAPAPMYYAGPPWHSILAAEMDEFRTGLRALLANHSDILTSGEIDRIRKIDDSATLAFIGFLPQTLTIGRPGIRQPVCHGIEDDTAALFADVHHLRIASLQELRDIEPTLDEEWGRVVPLRSKNHIGKSRWKRSSHQ